MLEAYKDPVHIEEASPAETFTYQLGEWVCELKKLATRKKYALNISTTNGDKLGYLAFFLHPDTKELVFSGIYLDPSFRSKGLSKLFLGELERLASQIDYTFNRTKPQRKPITCALLTKQGFSPLRGFPESRRVFVGRTDVGLIGVHYECPDMRRQFESTRLYRNEPYITCGLGDLQYPVQVSTNRSYYRQGRTNE